MRICFPTMGNRGLQEQVGRSYNRVPYYTVYDTITHEMKFIPGSMIYQFGLRTLPRILRRLGVEFMAAHEMGPDAIETLNSEGIIVILGAKGTVKDVLDNLLSGGVTICKDDHHHEQAPAVSIQA